LALGGLGGAGDQAMLAFAADALALKHVEQANDRRQQIVEIVRDPAGELAHGLHLLGLTQRLLGLREASLFCEAIRHVDPGQECANPRAVRGKQRLELHLVDAAVETGITELLDIGEGFAAQRAAPDRRGRSEVFGPVGQKFVQGIADLRPLAVDALIGVRAGPVDGEPAIIEIERLDLPVGGFHDRCEQMTLSGAFGDALLQRGIELPVTRFARPQLCLAEHAFCRLGDDAEDAADRAVVIQYSRVGDVPVAGLAVAMTFDVEGAILGGECLSRSADAGQQRFEIVP
jgi:hypothetical protein